MHASGQMELLAMMPGWQELLIMGIVLLIILTPFVIPIALSRYFGICGIWWDDGMAFYKKKQCSNCQRFSWKMNKVCPFCNSAFAESRPHASNPPVVVASSPHQPQQQRPTAPPKQRVAAVPTPSKLTPCPDCGRQVSRLAVACPNCGRPLSATN